MKNKIIRSIISVIGFLFILFYIGPLISPGEYNIGLITGLGFGILLVLYAIFFNKVNLLTRNISKKKVGKAFLGIISTAVALCLCIGIFTFGSVLKYSFKTKEASDVAIVLGCIVNGDEPGIFLRGRINAAYDYLNENPNSIAILSGGQGSGELISEAECMYNELVAKGIDEGRLYIEDKSTSTKENFKYSAEVIKNNNIKCDKITVITNDFHEYRASQFAKINGLTPLRYPSKTPWNGYMPFATREIYGIIYQIYLKR